MVTERRGVKAQQVGDLVDGQAGKMVETRVPCTRSPAFSRMQ
jgi:hypothetical protein